MKFFRFSIYIWLSLTVLSPNTIQGSEYEFSENIVEALQRAGSTLEAKQNRRILVGV